MATISPGAEQVALVQKVGALLGAITPARLLALTFLIGPRNPLPPEPLGSAIAAAAPPDPGYNFDQTLA